jgi:hypothetical protein
MCKPCKRYPAGFPTKWHKAYLSISFRSIVRKLFLRPRGEKWILGSARIRFFPLGEIGFASFCRESFGGIFCITHLPKWWRKLQLSCSFRFLIIARMVTAIFFSNVSLWFTFTEKHSLKTFSKRLFLLTNRPHIDSFCIPKYIWMLFHWIFEQISNILRWSQKNFWCTIPSCC